mgnify:CR=1 FL=1
MRCLLDSDYAPGLDRDDPNDSWCPLNLPLDKPSERNLVLGILRQIDGRGRLGVLMAAYDVTGRRQITEILLADVAGRGRKARAHAGRASA